MKSYLSTLNRIKSEIDEARKFIGEEKFVHLKKLQTNVEEISEAIKHEPPLDAGETEASINEVIANLDLLANDLKNQLISSSPRHKDAKTSKLRNSEILSK